MGYQMASNIPDWDGIPDRDMLYGVPDWGWYTRWGLDTRWGKIQNRGWVPVRGWSTR